MWLKNYVRHRASVVSVLYGKYVLGVLYKISVIYVCHGAVCCVCYGYYGCSTLFVSQGRARCSFPALT
jgi:hypothetical protein